MACCKGIPILGDIENAVVSVAESVGNAVENVVSGAADAVGKVVDSALSDPVGTIAKIATAIVAPELLPLVSAADTAAHGGDFGDILKSAGTSYIAGQVGQAVGGLGDQVGASAQYGTDLGSQQTAMLAAQDAGMGTAGDVAGNIAGSTAAGLVRGQDPLSALVSSGVSAGTSAITSQIPGFSDLSPAAQKAVNITVSASLMGKDPTQALINSAMNLGIAEAKNQITNSIDANNAINSYFDTNAGTGGLPSIPDEPATPEVSPLTTVGMTPEETAATNWASIYAEPTTNPVTGETITGGDPSNFPIQNFGDSAADQLNNGTINVGPGGFTSGWQTSGSDRIMIQDDGTAIGINENGDSYSLNPEEVSQMIANGQLNTAESGYVAATGGTGNLPGGSGNVTTPTKTTTPLTTTPQTTSSTPSAPSKTNPFGVLPLDSSPQMLTSTIPIKQSAKMADLHQLFNSLTPEMRDVFLSKGIAPSENGMTTAATGGLISDETSKILDSLNPKYISTPTHLQSVAPQQQESRLGALRHIGQGPLKGQGLSNRMSHGGLPHKYAEAAPEGHHPEFITGLTGYYAQGGGTGQSDDIPAMLHDGDFVMDADTVASLGDGSSKAGAEVLEKMRKQVPHQERSEGSPVAAKIADGEYVFPAAFVTAIGGGSNKVGAERLNEMREKIRAHKRSAPTTKIPPKAKSPLDYLKMAKG